MIEIECVKEAVRVLMDNGHDEDDALVIAEAIWDAYRSDSFPEEVSG